MSTCLVTYGSGEKENERERERVREGKSEREKAREIHTYSNFNASGHTWQ